MDNRKWEADAIVSPPTEPALPSDGYPTNGDPGAAQNATEPGAWWFHAIGEELRAVIIEGGLTPNISTLTQLRDAIKNIAKGGDYKASVRVASTAAINLAAPGASIDGVAMVAGDRFLEKDHATLASRGIYIWNGAAVAATRAADADAGTEFNGGAIIPVEEGTVNSDTNWQLTNNGTVTIGTTGLTFECIETKLFTGSNQSLATSGYQKLPGGLIIQWGSVDSAGASAGTLTFPITFPNICTHANVFDYASTRTVDFVRFNIPTVSNVTWLAQTFTGGISTTTANWSWFAIGY